MFQLGEIDYGPSVKALTIANVDFADSHISRKVDQFNYFVKKLFCPGWGGSEPSTFLRLFLSHFTTGATNAPNNGGFV